MDKRTGLSRRTGRAAATLLATVLLFCLSFAGGSSPFTVADTGEFLSALATASGESSAQLIYLKDSSTVVDLSSGTYNINSNVTIQLNGGTLRLSGATLYVAGSISGGALDVAGGTLVRSGGSITATIVASGSGTVRGARTLTLENLDPFSGESIVSITYAGESGSDTSSFVTKAATDTVYTKMTGFGFSAFQAIESVTTSAGHVFRLGTKYKDVLSLTYPISYGGLAGASLATLNPSSYTASDAAIMLVNPTKEDHTFAGWTCAELGIPMPIVKMVIPEGTMGSLTVVANWQEGQLSSKTGASSGSATGSTTTGATTDAEEQQAAAAASETAAATTTSRRVKTASSSTKVSFTSKADAALPSIASVEGKSFPWGWLLGAAAGGGALLYLFALVQRRRQTHKD